MENNTGTESCGIPPALGSTVLGRLETTEQTAHVVADVIIEHLSGENIAVSVTDAGGGRWRVSVDFVTAPDEDALRAAIGEAAGPDAAQALRFARVAATDWVRESLAGLAPVAAGRFTVHGAHDRDRIAHNRIGIEIEAALAFGTGHHGTTRGCLLALERMCKAASKQRPVRRHREVTERRPSRILDLGTGTGVLAIAAARALRRRVVATDIDASAVRIARANARLNCAGAVIELVAANGVRSESVRRRAPFDLVFANILLKPVQRLAAPLRRLLAPGGRVIISGILPAQANAAIAAYRPLALERRFDIDGWTTLVFARRPLPARPWPP